MLPDKSRLIPGFILMAVTLVTVDPARAGSSKSTRAAFTYVQGAATPFPASAGEPVLLTLQGRHPERLTLRQLRALPAVRYTTTQPQLQETFEYQGVPLRDLARRGQFDGQDIRVTADDGFIAIIRASDYQQFPVMLAYQANGRPIPDLKKGPLTIVFPPDPNRFPVRTYGSQWAWYVTSVGPR
ncbi:molybdopterin-dependent oxidoreductase [Deinococcus depolymerans]|uniref:Oxidoreductase molybdopterin-binding domain-containing protein n=1 Tax=Deinococcus depolymerans TaxID=392408 RepID=A0ABN1BSA3_9DEIO